jgi:hypothetical protein
MKQIRSFAVGACAGAALCASAGAQLHFGDIIIEVDAGAPGGSRVVTGTVDPDSGGVLPECVFPSIITAGDFALNPGFDSGLGVFPSSADLGFSIRRALRVWEGGTFDAIPDEWIDVTLGPIGPVSTPAADPASPILAIPNGVSVDGEFHVHYKFTLKAPLGPLGEIVPPDPGVYLLELELWIDPAIHQPSQPFWILFDHDEAPEALPEALEWVRANLAWCPDPFATCAADLSGDGTVDVFDLLAYLDLWFSGAAGADLDGTPGVDVFDLLMYLDAWFAGC